MNIPLAGCCQSTQIFSPTICQLNLLVDHKSFMSRLKPDPVSQNPMTSPQSLQHQTSSPTEKPLSMIGNGQNSRT